MKLTAVILTALLACTSLFADNAKIDTLTRQMGEKKAEFTESHKQYEVLKKELKTLKEQYNVAVSTKEKNRLALLINEKEKAKSAQYLKTTGLKNSFNSLSYLIAKEKHQALERVLSKQETIVAQKEQSCREMGLEDCQKKAYDATKKEVEKRSAETIAKRLEASGIAVDPKKVETGIQTRIQRYVNLDHGYFYAMKGEVNAELVLDETAMFDVEKITWNEMFEEPSEIAQIPLDNLPAPAPEAVIAPEEVAPSVYHSGYFASVVLSSQSHDLSSSGSTKATGFAFQLGYKGKEKDRFYYEHEMIGDGEDNDLTYKGIHVDWSVDLGRPIYPFFGVGYSIAYLKGSNYSYDGSAYHLRVGAGYELRDNMELDLTIRRSEVIWMIANGDTNIADLGISRNTLAYQLTWSYLF